MVCLATFRIEKTSNFTVLSNNIIDNRGMSFRARGLLVTMLRQPDDWDFSLKGLTCFGKEGKDAVRSALEELEALGYVRREGQSHDDGGKFTSGNYVVYEVPPDRVGISDTVNGTTVSGLPSRQIQHGDLKYKYLNNQELNNQIPPEAPKGAGEPKSQGRGAEPGWKPERFDAFWTYYPRHEAKQKAKAAWNKLKPDDITIDAMARALKRQKSSEEWQRGIGIPYASTYLNQQRWTDMEDTPQSNGDEAPAFPGPEVSSSW